MPIDKALTWTSDAQARLERVPDGASRDLTRQRVEALAHKLGQIEVTVELMEAKYEQWADGSDRATSEMPWTEDASRRIERIPPFVRGMVVQAAEAYARSHGISEISASTLDEVKSFWGETGRFHRP
jgi:hypothetical protein